jgi:hypothetical protein
MEFGSNLNEAHTIMVGNVLLIVDLKFLLLIGVAVNSLFMFNILIVCL